MKNEQRLFFTVAIQNLFIFRIWRCGDFRFVRRVLAWFDDWVWVPMVEAKRPVESPESMQWNPAQQNGAYPHVIRMLSKF